MYKITKPDFINNFIWIYELSRLNSFLFTKLLLKKKDRQK